MDDHGHGTYCAGIIGAVGNNASGVAGLNWQCKIMALKFISANNQAAIDGAVGSILYAVQEGARISSHSWIATFSQPFEDAVAYARSQGHLVVGGAGNYGTDNDQTLYYPASSALDNVISVSGYDNDHSMPEYLNYGLMTVDLIAPAVNVYSCWTSSCQFATGTSAACPHVAGAAALMMGLKPELDYLEVRGVIMSTVVPVPRADVRCVTGGVLNVERALRRVICAADFDYSGFVDTDDFDAFVYAFEAGGGNADIDASGFVDTDGFDAFVHALVIGC